MIGSRSASTAARTTRRTTVSVPSGSNILFSPIRVDEPAASTTAAVRAFGREEAAPSGMNGLHPFAQMARLPMSVHRQQLGDDAQPHLLRPVGADIDADRPEQPRVALHA